MLDRELYVGRQDFGSVNLGIRIIEGWIIEVLLHNSTDKKTFYLKMNVNEIIHCENMP